MRESCQAPPLAAIFLLSATALAYEVLLVRLFSIIYWHHFTFMVISLALLGYGVSGSLITLFRELFLRRYNRLFFINVLLFSISSIVVVLIVQQFPFNALEILWDRSQWLRLFLTYLLLSFPFLFVANTIAMTMLRFDGQIGRIYGADLIGAGVGAVGVMLLLNVYEPQSILRLTALCGLAAGLLFLRKSGWQFLPGAITLAVSMIAIVLLPSAWLQPGLSEYKGLKQMLLVGGTRVLENRSSPVSRIDVVESSDIPLRHAPGLSLQSPSGPLDQLAVFIDGDTMSSIDRYDGYQSPGYRDYLSSALPYHLGKSFSRVLILNATTGGEVFHAALQGVASIDAVEPDMGLLELMTDRYAGYSGWAHLAGRVSIHNVTARAWVASTGKQYDLVVLGVPGSSSGGSAGVHAFSVDYSLTRESLERYLSRLSPDGFLSVTLWTDTPPKGNLRLLATLLEAMRTTGMESPAERIAWIRSWNTATLLVKNGALTTDEIDMIRHFVQTRSFDLAWLPGIRDEEVNRFQLLPKPWFHEAAKALLTGEGDAFLKEYRYDIDPVNDSSPYFNDHFRWKSLPDFLAVPGRGGIAMIDVGYPTLIATLGQSLIAALLLILVPLLFIRSGPEKRAGSRLKIVIYFTAIGLAFLFIELSYIEILALIIGQPLYAVAVTLCVFLVFSGLGSLGVQRLIEKSGMKEGRLLGMAVSAILLMTLLSVALRPWITETLMSLPEAVRIPAACLLAAPLAFVMGMPFPLGLTATSRSAPALLPWAWGINGCASVLSAILAVLLAMEIGFDGVIILAALLYLVAWRSLPAVST